MMNLSIVIVSFNTKDLTIDCLNSIFKNKLQCEFDVWVVDNASSDGTVEIVKEKFPQIKLIEGKENVGFSRGNNLALKKIKSEFVLLLNSDTKLLPGSIDQLLEFSKEGDFAIASCKLLNPDKSFQPNAGKLPTPFPMFFWLSNLDGILNLPSYQERNISFFNDGEVGWVSGTVMLIKNQVFDKIGYLDDKIFMYGEDVDFCWRAKQKGFKIGWTKSAEVIHISGASSKGKSFYNQWRGEFKGLLYLYKKNYGQFAQVILRFLIYIFVTLRIIAFGILGDTKRAKNYAKVIVSI